MQVFSGAHHASIGSLSITNQGGNYTSITNNYQTISLDVDGPQPRFGRDEITAWLGGPNFRPIQQAAVAQRMLDTGTWFIESDEFGRFVSGDGCQLWGTGMPGSGKTVLSAIAVEHLENTFGEDVGVGLAFLRYNERHSTRDILAALLSQLLRANETAYALANVAYARARRFGAEPAEGHLVASLAEVRRALKRLFVVLDGLDEAADDVKDQLLRVLPPTGVNLLIMSRPLPLFVHHVPSAIHVPIQARTEDIAVFVLEYIRRSSRLGELLRDKPDSVEKLSARVKESSQGMFLVARLQMEAVHLKASSVNNVFKALDQLPSGINQMYDHTLNRIMAQPTEDASIAWRVFTWLLHAREPLTVRQMQTALCISFEKECFDPDDETPISTILTICGGLVTVEKRGAVEYFRFIHYTTREYMAKVEPPGPWNPHVILAVSCAVYLEAQAIYKSISEVAKLGSRNIRKGIRFGDLSKNLPLWYYALRNCGHHISGIVEWPLHPYLMAFLLKHERHYWQWPDEKSIGGTPFDFALHFRLFHAIQLGVFPLDVGECTIAEVDNAAQLGDSDLIAALLSSYVVAGIRKANGDTFLHTAVRYTQVAFIESLLSDNGARPAEGARRSMWDANMEAQINAPNCAGETPLMIACQSGENRLVQLLSSHQLCDPDLRDPVGKTALFYACRAPGREGPVPVALIRPPLTTVDVGVRCGEGTTVFMEACDFVQPQCICWLLAQDPSQVTQIDKSGRTPLMRLFRNGLKRDVVKADPTLFYSVLQLLLENGSDLQARDDEGLSAFLHAVSSFSASSNEWLIGNCLERMCTEDPSIINHCSRNGRTSLMLAASGRGTRVLHSGVVRFILSKPTFRPELLSARDQTGLTAFAHAFKATTQHTRTTVHIPAAIGNSAVLDVLRLLPSPWDAIPRQSATGDTLLHTFIRHGRTQLVKRLLYIYDVFATLQSEGTGYINVQNLAGETPLILACKKGNVEVVQAVALRRYCNPNIRDFSGKTAVFYALSKRTSGTPHILRTIEAITRCLARVTALMRTCQAGQEHTVRWHLNGDPADGRNGDKPERKVAQLSNSPLRGAAKPAKLEN